MSLLEKPLEAINQTLLEGLISGAVTESKFIEYKRELPGQPDSEKKEFLFDVSSFANAAGGDILYGIEAVDGLPQELVGVEKSTIDSDILRQEQIVRSGIAPRIPGLRMRSVDLRNGRCVLIVRIPRTWAGPHMVTFSGSNKFYSRGSAGKYLLSVEELRTAFSLGETLGEKMKAFRLERASAILNQELSVSLPNEGKTVLHILPTVSFRPGFQVDLLKVVEERADLMKPMKVQHSTGGHWNYDGLIRYGMMDRAPYSYVQMFRNGCLEAVECDLLRIRNNSKYFPSIAFEQEVILCGSRLLKLLEIIGVDGPYLVFLSYLGVRGYIMHVGVSGTSYGAHPIERDNLFLQEVVIESSHNEFAPAVRPIFDQVWNACGWPQSVNYNADGAWIGERR